MKVVIDTNVLIDVFSEREPFYSHSAQVLNMCEAGDVEGYVSVLTVKDMYYLIRKVFNCKKEALEAVRLTMKMCRGLNVCQDDVTLSLNAIGPDFEDNLIEAAAVRESFDYVVTRNTRHFGEMGIKAITPAELLEMFP